MVQLRCKKLLIGAAIDVDKRIKFGYIITMTKQDEQRNEAIREYISLGWFLEREEKDCFVVRKRKKFSWFTVIFGTILLLCFGLGVLVWIFGIVDYINQEDTYKTVYIKSDPIQKYYCFINDMVKGPYTAESMKELILSGHINDSTLCCDNPDNSWVTAEDIKWDWFQ